MPRASSPWSAPALFAHVHAQQPRFDNQTVIRIAWDPDPQPIAIAELTELLPLKKDQPYQPAAIRASIERLYATGRYRDIQVDTTPVEGGVAVRFITKGNWFIGHVGVESDVAEPPSAGQIVSSPALISAFLSNRCIAGFHRSTTPDERTSPVMNRRQRICKLLHKRSNLRTPTFAGSMSFFDTATYRECATE